MLENRIMDDDKQKIYNLITLIIAGLALIISGLSVIYSHNSNKIANESFYQTYRPRIQLSPAVLPSGEYFIVEERDNKFHIKIQLIAHNRGLSPATNITYIEEVHQIKIPDEELSFSPNPPKSSPSIGPSQEYYRMFSSVLEPVNYSPDRFKKLLAAMRKKEFTVHLIVTVQYFDEKYGKKHATHASYEFKNDSAKVIEYEEN